ncbi:hypothetical protein PUN28_003406 [Cardiocondyla obscurior]|uniref:MD-2-related lipid-recognition domain-containing protein n=1 Tax=Cardiocondyla obscurior TaxID=286306 RepID=A0AAW2GLT5_9HYME
MTRINIAFLISCVLCGITSSFAFVFEDCGSQLAKVGEISISSCTLSDEKCFLTRGNDINVIAKFTPNTDISSVMSYAYGVILDVPVPFPMGDPDLCKSSDHGFKCPLNKDQEYEYKATFNIEKKTPAVSIDVKFEFKNDKDEIISCTKFPAKIV